MSQTANSGKHPKGLFVLFFAEMWERFSYYGMRAILVLYVINGIYKGDKSYDAYANDSVYGSYTGLVFLTPLLGGYFADRIWGNRRCIVTGGFLMAIGQLLMFISGTFYDNTTLAQTIMWAGLGTIIIGNGFFKPNISTMVGQLYPKGDRRLDSAYTIFYMGINLGAFIAPLVCGGLGEHYDAAGNPIGGDFKWGFLAACFAMLLGTISFIFLKNKYLIGPAGESLGVLPNKMTPGKTDDTIPGETTASSFKSVLIWAVIGVALVAMFKYVLEQDWIGSFIFGVAIAVCGLIITDKSLTVKERNRVLVIFLSAFFVIFFWAAFEQAGSSLTLFAERNTNRTVNLETTMGTAILFVLAIALLLYWVLYRIMEIPKELKIVFSALAIGCFGYAVYEYISGTPYNLKDIPASWFNSANSMFLLLVAPLLSQFWMFLNKHKIEPSSPKKQSLGLLALALGYVVIAVGVNGVGPETKSSMLLLLTLYFLHTIGELCLSPIGLSLVNKLAPARFTSILMGVWFVSNAIANKLAGKLGALIPSTGSTEFLGYKINNLYDFFMLFVVMSGAAAILLFSLTFWMEKKMKD